MGGQTADTGYIRTAEGEFRVEDTVKMLGGKVGHIGRPLLHGLLLRYPCGLRWQLSEVLTYPCY